MEVGEVVVYFVGVEDDVGGFLGWLGIVDDFLE